MKTDPESFLSLTVRAASTDLAERVVAEAWDAGVSGVQELAVDGSGAIDLILYVSAERCEELTRAMAELASEGVVVGNPSAIEDVAWSEAWKDGLEAVVVSPNLVVRPSFVDFVPAPGQREIVLDPGQAFGTGGHASTRLALGWVDRLAPQLGGARRVLDAGTGSGVLAMAALARGAASAVGFDLDRVAVTEAQHWSRHNGFAGRLALFAGPIEALAECAFELVVANLLKSEVLPIGRALVQRLAPDGALVLSGLLAVERAEVEDAFGAWGLRGEAVLEEVDASGVTWISLCCTRQRRS